MEENKSVFVIVREQAAIKFKLWQEARENGYDQLSDYVRTFWDHLRNEKDTD